MFRGERVIIEGDVVVTRGAGVVRRGARFKSRGPRSNQRQDRRWLTFHDLRRRRVSGAPAQRVVYSALAHSPTHQMVTSPPVHEQLYPGVPPPHPA